jgi:hypothetical protein
VACAGQTDDVLGDGRKSQTSLGRSWQTSSVGRRGGEEQHETARASGAGRDGDELERAAAAFVTTRGSKTGRTQWRAACEERGARARARERGAARGGESQRRPSGLSEERRGGGDTLGLTRSGGEWWEDLNGKRRKLGAKRKGPAAGGGEENGQGWPVLLARVWPSGPHGLPAGPWLAWPVERIPLPFFFYKTFSLFIFPVCFQNHFK